MKLSIKIFLPIILISALLILLNGCTGTVPDDSPGYTPGSITGRIMVPSDCSDCLTDGTCLPPKSINDDVPSHWVSAEDAIVTVIPHSTLTDEDGYYTLTDVEPGVYYVITATYKNLVLKDVVEPDGVEAGKIYDAGTANCESTALALVVEYLWDMGLDADEIEATLETYIETDKFADLVDTVCCIIEDCDNITNYCCLVECEPPGFTCSTTSLNISIPTPACDVTCTTISKPITVRFVSKDDVVINDFSDSRLDWNIPSGINFTESSGEVCLTGAVGTYNIKVTYVDPLPDDCGSISKTIPVTFSDCSCPLPSANAGGPYSKTVTCPATTATIVFSGSASGTGTLTYDWDFGDGSTHGTGSSPSHIYTYPFSSPYTVTLTVTNACGSVEVTTTVNITYVPCCTPPTANARGPYSKTVTCPATAATINFVGSASGTGTFTYDWDFGDGSTHGTGSSPSHIYTYPFSSPYTVTLTVTGDCGSDTDTTTVDITYTPCITCNECNMDGGNDCYGVSSYSVYDSSTNTTTFTYTVWEKSRSKCDDPDPCKDISHFQLDFGSSSWDVSMSIDEGTGGYTEEVRRGLIKMDVNDGFIQGTITITFDGCVEAVSSPCCRGILTIKAGSGWGSEHQFYVCKPNMP